ncbi:MAG: copper resistance protein NlpE [Flavobacterium sp.]
MKKILLLFLACSAVLLSCKKQTTDAIGNAAGAQNTANAKEGSVIMPSKGATSQNSLDWTGIYKGVTPCANCEGIVTELSLNSGSFYVLRTQYLGKGGTINEIKGSFSWDKSGSVVVLNGVENRPNQFKVGENYVVQLDMKGDIVAGDLASKYILTKVK